LGGQALALKNASQKRMLSLNKRLLDKSVFSSLSRSRIFRKRHLEALFIADQMSLSGRKRDKRGK
jgi:hypothetical protein